jgi:hypothetical protein
MPNNMLCASNCQKPLYPLQWFKTGRVRKCSDRTKCSSLDSLELEGLNRSFQRERALSEIQLGQDSFTVISQHV